MDMHSRNQYLQTLQGEYLQSSKARRGQLLDEAERRTGLVRKYLTRRLSPTTRWVAHPVVRGRRPRTYGSDLIAPLVRCWDIFERPCGARLAALLTAEVARLRSFGELWITEEQATQLQAVSGRTIDRLLSHEKEVRHQREQRGERPNPLLYQLVPTKVSDEADRTTPGFEQLDAVEHCGATTTGEYVTSVGSVDAASYWWEATAIMGKGQRPTTGALDANRRRTPFAWREAHPDNGSSFLNYHLWGYAQRTKLQLSRSRPYKKNDNCFVEQTNGDNIRQYVGHVRYDTAAELELLNELYVDLRLFKNFFQPVLRLDTKTRLKGPVSRRYHEATTPYQWLLDCPTIPEATKHRLRTEYEQLNPAELRRKIDATLAKLAQTYAVKHAPQTADLAAQKVTFSFGATAHVRLPAHVA